MNNVYALVMAGGSGTRFWPASRHARPKQLLAIAPGSNESLLESTIRRIVPLCPPERVLVVTAAHLLDATREALAAYPAVQVVAEPSPRNTAPCIGWGSALLARRDPNGVVMALPSDHHIRDEAAFLDALRTAVRSAEEGVVTTIGLRPTRPETGFGHIEAGDELRPGVRQALRFVEKPDLPRAKEYAESGRHFWNSGMFFFRASDMLGAIRTHMPELSTGLERMEEAAKRGSEAEADATRTVFPTLPNISIDYGVMERLTDVRVVPADFGWSDVGSWLAAWELGAPDEARNVADESTILVNAEGNLVRQLGEKKRVIALVGVRDLCVIETDDAILVIPKDQAQDVRKVVDELKRRGQRDVL